MKTTQSFCQPLLFLNFLRRYPDNWFSRARWWSIIATEVALQHLHLIQSSVSFWTLTCASRHGPSCWTSGPRAVSPVSWISRSSPTCPGRRHSQTSTLSSDICCCSVTRCLAPSQTEMRMESNLDPIKKNKIYNDVLHLYMCIVYLCTYVQCT